GAQALLDTLTPDEYVGPVLIKYGADIFVRGRREMREGTSQSSSSSSTLSTMRVSVDSTSDAIDAALRSADRVTFTGSMMPFSSMSTYSPDLTSSPCPASSPLTLSMTTNPSSPAFSAIHRSGSTSARRTMPTAVAASPVSPSTPSSNAVAACTSDAPPPARMPS